MQHRPFGPIGRSVAVIGQGTWEMERARDRSIRALRCGLDLGMTHVDTAEMYGSGRVEELVGEAIAGRRDEVFLVTKVLPSNASRRGTVEACERSLRRLRCDHVDLYLLHWPSRHPLEETIGGFEELRAAGKIGAWGVSNFDAEQVARAAAIAGPGVVACNQVLYHLGERGIEHEVMPACRRLGVAVVGYSPFGQGDLPAADATIAEVARARGVTPAQVALAFLVRDPNVFTIPKASSTEHVEANAGAGDLVLDDEDVARLERAFPLGARPRGVPTL